MMENDAVEEVGQPESEFVSYTDPDSVLNYVIVFEPAWISRNCLVGDSTKIREAVFDIPLPPIFSFLSLKKLLNKASVDYFPKRNSGPDLRRIINW